MKIGLNDTPKHESPEQWAEILKEKGYSATSFPINYEAKVSLIDAYVLAAKERGIVIAEVGIWNSPHVPGHKEAEKAREICREQLALADYIRAKCCVNVSGGAGEIWYGCYRENYSQDMYDKNVEFVQRLCDEIKPQNTYFTLEPMQWMVPDSPEQYLKFLQHVDRERFGVHMDMVNFIKDTYTYTHKEELLEKSFSLLGKYIKSCHIKDCIMDPGLTVNLREVPLGEGTMILNAYLKKINDLKEDIPVLIEHLPNMEAYDKALEVCKGIMATWTGSEV